MSINAATTTPPPTSPIIDLPSGREALSSWGLEPPPPLASSHTSPLQAASSDKSKKSGPIPFCEELTTSCSFVTEQSMHKRLCLAQTVLLVTSPPVSTHAPTSQDRLSSQ
uniref:Uncharacterized protein n=1 Tax=Trieres chinensis TaxID=1514140 RepID=A0A7S1ZZN2_TRICV